MGWNGNSEVYEICESRCIYKYGVQRNESKVNNTEKDRQHGQKIFLFALNKKYKLPMLKL